MRQQSADIRLWFALLLVDAITGCLSIRYTM